VKKIVVIGTGRMGGAFATAFAKRTSHTVSIRGSHAGSSSAAALSHQLGVRVADDKDLLAADVVFVATPPAALDDVAAALKGYAGIIVSAMVPGARGYELKRDDGSSAAEQLARLIPKGRVVTAFTSISSALIRDPASGEKATVFTGADDNRPIATTSGPVEAVENTALSPGGSFKARGFPASGPQHGKQRAWPLASRPNQGSQCGAF
jgi:predicted dinucleotide-binding enzyme